MIQYNDSLTIADVYRYISVHHERTCIISNSEGMLYGVVSQGDLLKALWNGHELLTPIDKVINPNPVFIKSTGANLEVEALALFSKYGVLLIPVVDEAKRIQSVISIREIVSQIYVKK